MIWGNDVQDRKNLQPDFHQRLRKLLLRSGIVLCAAVGMIVLYRLLGFGIPCPIYRLTGLYCPGCGSMRAMNAFAQLDFYSGFQYNVLLVILIPVFLLLYILYCVDELRGKHKTRHWETPLCVVLIVVSVLYGVLRNIPYFEMLRPIP